MRRVDVERGEGYSEYVCDYATLELSGRGKRDRIRSEDKSIIFDLRVDEGIEDEDEEGR
ncbi:MAG: hypothetical protein AAGB46_00315 [Verrucomicrobiota bacterium]